MSRGRKNEKKANPKKQAEALEQRFHDQLRARLMERKVCFFFLFVCLMERNVVFLWLSEAYAGFFRLSSGGSLNLFLGVSWAGERGRFFLEQTAFRTANPNATAVAALTAFGRWCSPKTFFLRGPVPECANYTSKT